MKHRLTIFWGLVAIFLMTSGSSSLRNTARTGNVTDKTPAKRNASKINIPKDIIRGDYNGDGRLDSMWLVPAQVDSEGTGCIGKCASYIKFSDPNIPSIKVDKCIGGKPSNEHDLNKNGTDEIGLSPEWFTSCWTVYYVWTFVNGKWVHAVKPFPTHCNQWEAKVKPIEIDLKRKGYVIIRYSELAGEDIVTKSRSVKIAK